VHADVHDDLLDALSAAMAGIRVGPTSAATTTYGPVVSQSQLGSVLSAIEQARAQGGRVVRGGERLTAEPLDRGFYVDPTLVEVSPDTALWREEVFGPVLAITTTRDLDSAIDLVNDSPYGLSAAIFTRDLGDSHAFVDRVMTGQVAVNLPTSGWDVHLPFGGFKDSGSPFKEQGTEGMGFYTRVKTVAMRVG
jgi:NAD-dependent aldehyde dehydrogenases